VSVVIIFVTRIKYYTMHNYEEPVRFVEDNGFSYIHLFIGAGLKIYFIYEGKKTRPGGKG
jgi:hypothetical protein